MSTPEAGVRAYRLPGRQRGEAQPHLSLEAAYSQDDDVLSESNCARKAPSWFPEPFRFHRSRLSISIGDLWSGFTSPNPGPLRDFAINVMNGPPSCT